jgi:NADPH-dependent ferric siderophore reductase
MATPDQTPAPGRARREPPPFRHVAVRRVQRLSPRLARVTLSGSDLAGFTVERPAASVRLLLPSPGERELVMPAWNGNEFLRPDGERPHIRTLTPRRVDPVALELDVDIVIHGRGTASNWAEAAALGDLVAVSGPGRGYLIEPGGRLVLAGDETAIPAISQLLETAPVDMEIQVHIEVTHHDARHALPHHPGAALWWYDLPAGAAPGDALVGAVRSIELPGQARVWVAGEAAAVQRIRRFLFEERGFPRSQATVRGYWKHGRGAGADDDAG